MIVLVFKIQPMARLIILLKQHLDRQPPTVITQAKTWWDTTDFIGLYQVGKY